MNNKNPNERKLIHQYIGIHPNYGNNSNICNICGAIYDLSGKVILEGDRGRLWDGEHYEFPVCSICFYEALGTLMGQMDDIILQREIEKEKRRENEWLEYDPPC